MIELLVISSFFGWVCASIIAVITIGTLYRGYKYLGILIKKEKEHE